MHYTVESSRLPAAFDHFRVAVISELHNEEYGENNSGLISLVGAEQPDIRTFRRVSDLSGGERAKLGFAVLMRLEANVLLLDEPTNHLDLPPHVSR